MRALAVVVLVGCTGVKPVRERVRATALAGAVLVVPGETMEFRIALRGITVAEVQTAIGWPGTFEGRRAVIVRSRGKTSGLLQLIGDLTWELTSTIDTARGQPIEDHEEAWVAMAGQKDHSNEHHHWDADEQRHDIHSAVGVVRGWRSKPGDRSELEVVIGGGHIDLTLRDVGRSFAAHQPAIRYDGLARGEFPISMWISDDAARAPLRFTAQSPWGEITVDLVDYQIPSDH
jgi:hypothetical protein